MRTVGGMNRAAVVPEIEVSIDIAAPPARVWSIVADPASMESLSGMVAKTVVRGGRPVGVGTKTVNLNRDRWLLWPTTGEVIEFDPPRRYAMRIPFNRSVWSYTLEPIESGTRVTHRRDMPRGIPAFSSWLIEKTAGGQQRFAEQLRRGMTRTLSALKNQAES